MRKKTGRYRFNRRLGDWESGFGSLTDDYFLGACDKLPFECLTSRVSVIHKLTANVALSDFISIFFGQV